MSESSVSKQSYRGNCHCGAVKFTVDLAPVTKAAQCNCSICSRKGYLFAVTDKSSDLTIETGAHALKTYTFGNGVAEHKFCPTCGSAILVQAQKIGFLAVNINTFKHGSVDIEALEISTSDRLNIEPVYKPFVLSADQTPQIPKDHKLYTGSCHCQAIKYTVLCPEIKTVRTCNCSFCSRNADMWIYPPIPAVSLLGTEEKLTTYLFGPERSYHGFCGVCGVDVVNRVDLHPKFKANVRPINVRTIDGIDLGELKVEKADGWALNTGPYKAYDV